MAHPGLSYLSEAEKEFIHEQTLRVLAEVGVAFNTPVAIDLLSEAGAQVDRQRLSARLPRELVEECLRLVPRRVLLAARDPAHDVVLDEGCPLACTTDGLGFLVMDDLTGEVREATVADIRTAYHLFDALPELDYVWSSLSSREIGADAMGLESDVLYLRSTAKHLQSGVPRPPDQVAPLLDILEAVAGAPLRERPIYSFVDCPVAPLQHDPHMTELCLELVSHGVPIVVLPMPLMGQTGPITVVGSTIVNMAEFLSAVVLYQLKAPGCALISGPAPAVSDMRTGSYLCGAPEVGLLNLATLEMSKYCGVPTLGMGITSDAKAVNFQAGAEGMMTAMAAALEADAFVSAGLIDGAQVVTLAKIVLDAESVGMIKRFVRHTEISDETTLFDDIADVGIGGHYLARKSTRRFNRAGEIWQARVFQRGPRELFLGKNLVGEAVQKAHELLTSHEVLPIAEDVDRHIDEVVASYAAARGHAQG